MMVERKWTIRDIDGSNPREVTLAEFKAAHHQKCDEAKAIYSRNAAAVQSDIERRAADLAKWNPTQTAQWAMQHAQSEAAAGALPSYTPIAIAQREVDRLTHNIVIAENAPRYDAAFIDQLNAALSAAKKRLLALRGADQSIAAE